MRARFSSVSSSSFALSSSASASKAVVFDSSSSRISSSHKTTHPRTHSHHIRDTPLTLVHRKLAIMPEGTVEIELIKGHDLKDVEAFGRSDPYATLAVGGQKHRSKTIHDGGKNPVWNESFLIEIPDGPHELDIVVYDQEKHGSDEAMGSVNISLLKLFAERQIPPSKYKVQRPNGKFEGELELGLKFFPKVHHGVLDVHLIEAHGLLDSDTFGKSDPYAVIYCHKDIQKSRVIERNVNPVWNEHFRFNVDNEVTEVLIKLFDKDDMRSDDPLGNVVIPLHKVFSEGEVLPTKYKVLGAKGQPQGEVSVALRFAPTN